MAKLLAGSQVTGVRFPLGPHVSSESASSLRKILILLRHSAIPPLKIAVAILLLFYILCLFW